MTRSLSSQTGRPYSVFKSDNRDIFSNVINAIRDNDEDRVITIMNPAKVIEHVCKAVDDITYEHGFVWYRGIQVNNYCVDKLLELRAAGIDVRYFEKLLINIYANPNKEVIPYLYEFLEYGNLPITERGTFLAFKRVRANYTDIHSGKFDNSPGQVVTEDRSVVNSDRDQICARGLHFCSFEYLSSFGSHEAASDRVMIVEINPTDVVMIPRDYNNTKARCCKYTVLYDFGEPWANIKKSDLKDELNKPAIEISNNSKIKVHPNTLPLTNKIKAIVEDYMSWGYPEDVAKINVNTTLEDTGLDSLDGIELLMMIEEEFAAEIDDDYAQNYLIRGDATIASIADGLIRYDGFTKNHRQPFKSIASSDEIARAETKNKPKVAVPAPIQLCKSKPLPARDEKGRFVKATNVKPANPTLGETRIVQSVGSPNLRSEYWNGTRWMILNPGDRMRNAAGHFIAGQKYNANTGYFYIAV